MSFVLVAAVIFFATFTQSVSGFGSGLVAMALLPLILDLRVAAPLVALASFCAECFILLKYRRALRFHNVARLAAASLLGIPFGLLALERVGSDLILRALSIVIMLYSIYALLNLRLPEIRDRRWAYGFGFISGMLAGLYNVGGPPIVIYGACRRWSPDEFRSNLQAFFIVNSVVVIAGHALSQNYTPVVWQHFLAAAPAIIAGALAGFAAASHMNAALFRKVVFVLLLLLGLRQLF